MPESAQLSRTAKAKHGCRVAAVAALLVACICAVVVAALSGGYYVANTPGSFLLAAPPPTIPPSTLTVAQNWPIAFSDSFHSNANAWNVSDTQPETNSSGKFRETIEGGQFRIESQATESVSKQFWPSMHDISDLYLAVDAQRLSGDSSAAYGVIFHWTDQLPSAYLLGNFYLFEIRDDQQFAVLLYQGGWIDLIKLTRTNAIQPGAVNHLAVLVQGKHLSFLINHQLVGAIDDNRVPSGKAGVAIDMAAGQAVFQFSNFELHSPE